MLFGLRNLNLRQSIKQSISASYSVIGSYFTWKAFCCVYRNDSPIVCVLTQSMEPGFKRGDILLLGHRSRDGSRPFHVGDTSVYSIRRGSIPIVHRVIKEDMTTNQCLTKGDNNAGDDVSLYRPGQKVLNPEDMETTVLGYVPFFGMPTIWISSIPFMRELILICTALYYFGSRE
ncbi:Signal peptidase complex catalytic subunit SEC11 [Enterospora canceri]|uniref:Signal peptidase complex catalytic subunit SEC11 n=1 Tax=Enterospora canceri TaxID=1081671 RepID=A0A1Y1S9B8_9MICR|nr:Signal peptidase complex catalytic subunit SEC11 [Enterospora canceri]